jgi:hypothetical protein
VVNFVAVDPTDRGNLRAWAYAAPAPAASILNYSYLPGTTLNIANAVVVPLCNPGPAGCPFDISVQADVSSTHLVADVLGFFEPYPIDEARPFAVYDYIVEPTRIGRFCTSVGASAVPVNAPVAGRVVVRGAVQVSLSHADSVPERLTVGVSDSLTDCPSHASYEIPASAPITSYSTNLALFATFAVTAGAHTYYLNAVTEQGGPTYGANVFFAQLEYVFYPN